MKMMDALKAFAESRPTTTSWIGTVSGWFSVEMLVKEAQIFAALMAGFVSFCALILTIGPTIKKLREYRQAWREWRKRK